MRILVAAASRCGATAEIADAIASTLRAHGFGQVDAQPVWLFSSGPVGDPRRALVRKMDRRPPDIPTIMTNVGVRQRLALTLFRGFEGDFRDWDHHVARWAGHIADELQKVGERPRRPPRLRVHP